MTRTVTATAAWSINVSSDSSSFKLQRMYQISVNPSSWVKDTDYTLSLRVTDASGAERKAEFGYGCKLGQDLHKLPVCRW